MAMTFRIVQVTAVLVCVAVSLVRGRAVWNSDDSIVLLGAEPNGGAILPINTANLVMVNDRDGRRSILHIGDLFNREDDWKEDKTSDSELNDWGYDESNDMVEGDESKNDIGQIGLNNGNIEEFNYDEGRRLIKFPSHSGLGNRKNRYMVADFYEDESQSDEGENDIGQIGINNGQIQEWNYGGGNRY